MHSTLKQRSLCRSAKSCLKYKDDCFYEDTKSRNTTNILDDLVNNLELSNASINNSSLESTSQSNSFTDPSDLLDKRILTSDVEECLIPLSDTLVPLGDTLIPLSDTLVPLGDKTTFTNNPKELEDEEDCPQCEFRESVVKRLDEVSAILARTEDSLVSMTLALKVLERRFNDMAKLTNLPPLTIALESNVENNQ
jgi:hypothetical protein